jgi:anti-anti-sigma factor
MAATADLGPLTFERVGERVCFRLTAPGRIEFELPPDFELFLEKKLAPLRDEPGALRPYIDLELLPAISSRQLGALLALQKVLRERVARLPIVGAHDAVRRVFQTTRVDQLFEFV